MADGRVQPHDTGLLQNFHVSRPISPNSLPSLPPLFHSLFSPHTSPIVSPCLPLLRRCYICTFSSSSCSPSSPIIYFTFPSFYTMPSFPGARGHHWQCIGSRKSEKWVSGSSLRLALGGDWCPVTARQLLRHCTAQLQHLNLKTIYNSAVVDGASQMRWGGLKINPKGVVSECLCVFPFRMQPQRAPPGTSLQVVLTDEAGRGATSSFMSTLRQCSL